MIDPAADNIVPTLGAYGALIVVMNAMALSGDRIAFEDLSYPATIRASAMIGRRPIAVRMTEDGLTLSILSMFVLNSTESCGPYPNHQQPNIDHNTA